MLKITLYKGCKLNNQYVEVFATKSALETYLSGLTKVSYEIDTLYQVNSGTFNIEMDYTNNNTVYEYNYMKVESKDEEALTYNFVRYCFINNISIRNEIAVINYSEDIWSSYAYTMKMSKSYLSRSTANKYKEFDTTIKDIDLLNIPVPYQSVKPLDYSFTATGNYSIFVELQYYNTAKYGEATERKSRAVRLYHSYFYDDGGIKGGYDNYFQFNELIKIIEYITLQQSNNVFFKIEDTVLKQESGTGMYFQIDNITIMPKSFTDLIDGVGTGSINVFPSIDEVSLGGDLGFEEVGRLIYNIGLDENEAISFVAPFDKTVHNRFIKGKEITVSNDFKNYSVGTRTSQYEIINNGKERKLEILHNIGNYNYDLFLNFDNKVINITDDFVVKLPFEALLGEEQTQRKLQRQLKTVNGVASIAGGVVDTAGSIVGTIASGGATSVSQLTKTGKIANNAVARTKRTASYMNAGVSGVESATSGIGQIVGGITDIINANQPNYTSSTGTFSQSDGLLNAKCGIVVCKINADNETFVNKMIENVGYQVYEIDFDATKYLPYTNNTRLYKNAIKYDFVSLYGDFSQNINASLTDILLNGVILLF